MKNSHLKAVELEMHEKAKERAKQYVENFAESIVLQSKVIAHNTKADSVHANHIDEAFEVLNKEKKSWVRDLVMSLGSAAFGAFIPGFISGLTNGDIQSIVIYVILGFIGITMVFLGLRR